VASTIHGESRKDAAIDRVRKLLRLSESPNGHEASSAKERAEELMRSHGLTADDVAEDIIAVAETNGAPERADLARVIALATSCTALSSKRVAIAFKGIQRNVNRAMDAYRAFVMEGERSSAMPPDGCPPLAAREVWRLCFWMGMTCVAAERLVGGRKARPGTNPQPSIQIEAAPETVKSALYSLEYLADEIANTTDDVQGVLERLRTRAYDAGRFAGESVVLKEIDSHMRLGRG